MDSVTHIALGACIGEALLPKRLGKKRLAIGAVAQSVPDIDIIGSLWNSTAEDLWFHRGITHSFIFGIAAAFLLALLTRKVFKKYHLPIRHLALFFCLQIWLHDILDTCNSYGTGLLEPFSHQRFSFDLLFVLDPLFSLPLVLAFGVLLFLKTNHSSRKIWIMAGLFLPCFYLIYAVSNKTSVEKQISRHLPGQAAFKESFISTPTAFNTWLWYIMVPAENGYYIGYRSVFDKQNHQTPFVFFAKNDYYLDSIANTPSVIALKKFSHDYYTVENRKDSLIFNVLRFGRIAGWDTIPTQFTFQFYLNEGFDNTLVVQRGRAREINLQTFKKMIGRIKGIQ